MADVGETTSSEDLESSFESLSSPKKVESLKTMKTGTKSAPTTAEMVYEALDQLKERGGSSLPAIKKYITTTYDNLDMERRAILIRKYLKTAVADGSVIQTKGRGASGSFRLPSVKEKSVAAKAAAKGEVPVAKKPTAVKKTDSGKVSSSTKKQASSKKVKKAPILSQKTKTGDHSVQPKSPSRTKRIARSPTSKPKAPRPKKVSAALKSPKVAPRKMTAAKK